MESKEQIETNIEVLDKLDTYQIIADEAELRWFYDHVIQKPGYDEAYAFCLAHRSKKLTEEERKNFRAKESEMLDPQVVFPARDGSFDFHRWAKGIYRYETNKRAYSLIEGRPLFAKAMVLYCTPNPSDERKVVKELKSYIQVHEQELVDSALKGSRAGIDESMYKLCHSLVKFKRLQFDCTGSKNWVDFDMDVRENLVRDKLYEIAYQKFEEKVGKGNFIFVETTGGFHILLKKECIRFNPNDLINVIMHEQFKLWGEVEEKYKANNTEVKFMVDEFNYNTNCMLPVPGTYQYGNIVRVKNKEDF